MPRDPHPMDVCHCGQLREDHREYGGEVTCGGFSLSDTAEDMARWSEEATELLIATRSPDSDQ